jgi:hypothetical protein
VGVGQGVSEGRDCGGENVALSAFSLGKKMPAGGAGKEGESHEESGLYTGEAYDGSGDGEQVD